MKRLSILLMSVAILALGSCKLTKSVSASDSAAVMSGKQCAIASNSLYNTYKSTGKLDLSNNTNVTNILTVITSYNQLKENKNNTSYRKAFAKGAASAGTQLITSANSERFIDALLNCTALNGVTAQNIQQKAQTASTIITLFNALN